MDICFSRYFDKIDVMAQMLTRLSEIDFNVNNVTNEINE